MRRLTVRVGRARVLPFALLALLIFTAIGFAAVASAETADYGPGKYTADLLSGAKQVDVGDVEFFNDQQKLYINVLPDEGWTIVEVKAYVGGDPVPVNKQGLPRLGKFPYAVGPAGSTLVLDLRDDLGVRWGVPFQETWTKNVAVKVQLAKSSNGKAASAWAEGSRFFKPKNAALGQWFTYKVQRPGKGHFVDSPVGGLGYGTETFNAVTDESGSFLYHPGETATFYLAGYPIGSVAGGANKVTPLHIFGTEQIDDIRVKNMARLLQSLDADGQPKDKIYIPASVQDALAQTAQEWVDSVWADAETDGFAFDFTDTDQIDFLIDGTIAKMAGVDGVTLRKVSAEEALANLAKTLEATGGIIVKNVSKSAETATEKARLDFTTNYVPTMTASGEPTVVEYHDEYGDLIETRDEAQPLVMAWTEENAATGGSDVYAAVSRDDGQTWKRTNISRYSDDSSFTLANGEADPAKSFKPSLQVLDVKDANGNIVDTQVMIIWTSSFARQGNPRYAIDPVDDYTADDPYYTEDIWGVRGSQRSHDYTEDGFPEVGEIPYYVVWSARGSMDIDTGEVTWYKPERITSGRRNAMQLVLAKAANGAGWGTIWQEDPDGIRPGSGDGPGAGWSGAITSNGTDIWYSYLEAKNFATVDESFVSSGDPQNPALDDENADEFAGRPKALVPWALPVRVSDNEMVNTENLGVELGEDGLPKVGEDGKYIPILNDNEETEGTREYAYKLDGTGIIAGFIDIETGSGDIKKVAYTADKRVLDGDTGAARPALFLQGYTKPDGSISAYTIIGYEETKGLGGGQREEDEVHEAGEPEYKADLGKNIMYHSFDFKTLNKTTLVSGGTRLNPQAVLHAPLAENPDLEVLVDETGNPTDTPVLAWATEEDGTPILDAWDNPIPATENARRPRFLAQGKTAALGTGTASQKADGVKGTVMVMVFKMGEAGKGGASDVYIQRWMVSNKDTGNPYDAKWIPKDASGQFAVTNVSAVTPTVWVDNEVPNEDEEKDKGIRVTRWTQGPTNTNDYSWEYSNDSGQGQRGYLRGDFLLLAYTYSANFRAADNGNDAYNLYIRRSFDGGANFTVAPSTAPYKGTGALWEQYWRNPGEGTYEIESYEIKPGTFDRINMKWTSADIGYEPARNITRLVKNEVNIIEPRTTAAPGTIPAHLNPQGQLVQYPDDINNPAVHWLFWGTGSLYLANSSDEEDEGKQPYDLGYTFTRNWGDEWVYEEKTVPTDSDGNHAGETLFRPYFLAKGPGGEGEAQAKFSPDGSKAYVAYTDIGPYPVADEDAYFARIMPYAFPQNQALAEPVAPQLIQ